ncbi:MAG: alpha-galactosidase [Candidatus Aminicenantes bacterium]|nr:alpha-galactosidase [Candidatus Aminicenantes bacterium]
MNIFGKALAVGPLVHDDGRARIEAVVEPIKGGHKITGTVKGRPGTIEIFRAPAPGEFLANNWQSWGPMQRLTPGQKFEGLEERMKNQGRFVFTPIPEIAQARLVSDYFFAWEGGLAGFLTSMVAHPYFTIEGGEVAGYLEYFGTPLEDPVPLEPFILLEGHPVELLFEEYAVRAAIENNVRVNPWNPVGWSSWYQYFTGLRMADVEKNLRLARPNFPFEVFQIDDGFESDIGDWLSPKEGFASLPELARLIRDHGFHAGIWTAPFSAAETSELFARHPDWMVSDIGLPKVCYRGWKKDIYALDTSNPRVMNWLYETFTALKKMGFDYFKIDFVFSAAMPGVRSRRVSPVQAYRQGLDVIRQAVGDAFILGCGAPLLPSIGLVDGMRVGEDTAPFWDSSKAPLHGVNAYYALRNSILRSFMHKKWWLNDPDCLLLRCRDIELTDNEKELYARTAGALDNMIIESDDLELVDEWGRSLLQEAVRLRGGHVRVRGLMSDDLYVIDSWGGPAGIFRYAANLSDRQRSLDGLDIPSRTGVFIKP